jgi:phosphate acetyltransferase
MNGLCIVGAEHPSGFSAVALGVHELMGRRFGRLGVFRPIVESRQFDPLLVLLGSRAVPAGAGLAAVGATFEEVQADQDRAAQEIVGRCRAFARECDGVLVLASGAPGTGVVGELGFNARIAADLGLPVLSVISGARRSAEEVVVAADVALDALREAGCDVVAIVANRVIGELRDELSRRLGGREPPAYVLPESELLAAPTVADLMAACSATLIAGEELMVGLEATGFVVASMTLPNLLDRLVDGAVVITGGDRADVVLGVLVAHASTVWPTLSGMMLTGGLRPAPQLERLIAGIGSRLPIVLTEHSTYQAAHLAGAAVGRITPSAARKIETALSLFERHVDGAALLNRLAVARSRAVTPLMFQYELFDRARADPRHIVLAEGTDERVLRAADTLLRREVVALTLLGDPAQVRGRAVQLQLDISNAAVLDPADDQLRERFATEYATRRAHKGVTLDAARDIVSDVSYFATMMVLLGLADGMVSGAAHTTAATVRPAFELIKSKPGVTLVSSVFFMCLRDRVLVYGDCAINSDPTADQLADIAITAADTAAQFGIDPRVAMLSYSTGQSSHGTTVDKVRDATAIVRTRRPDLPLEGPIQYDAAVDPVVAETKLPGSTVAGHATVLIFPDLNTGNNTYKAVQRSSGAVAIGPVLQGLNKPVNDLSRGAGIQDIINTVAITAIQAQGHR